MFFFQIKLIIYEKLLHSSNILCTFQCHGINILLNVLFYLVENTSIKQKYLNFHMLMRGT